jgi:hypothetical protein
MCESRIVTVVPKHEVVIAEHASWLEDHSAVKVTIPEQKQEIIICRHLKWGKEMTDAELQTKAIKEVNDYWDSKADATTKKYKGKDRDTVLTSGWENTLKGKVGKAEIEKERDRLKGLIDTA